MMAVLVVNENEPPEQTSVEYSRVRIVKMAQERTYSTDVSTTLYSQATDALANTSAYLHCRMSTPNKSKRPIIIVTRANKYVQSIPP